MTLLDQLTGNNWCLLKYQDGQWFRADRLGIVQCRGHEVPAVKVTPLIAGGALVQVFSKLLPDIEIWRPRTCVKLVAKGGDEPQTKP